MNDPTCLRCRAHAPMLCAEHMVVHSILILGGDQWEPTHEQMEDCVSIVTPKFDDDSSCVIALARASVYEDLGVTDVDTLACIVRAKAAVADGTAIFLSSYEEYELFLTVGLHCFT